MVDHVDIYVDLGEMQKIKLFTLDSKEKRTTR